LFVHSICWRRLKARRRPEPKADHRQGDRRCCADYLKGSAGTPEVRRRHSRRAAQALQKGAGAVAGPSWALAALAAALASLAAALATLAALAGFRRLWRSCRPSCWRWRSRAAGSLAAGGFGGCNPNTLQRGTSEERAFGSSAFQATFRRRRKCPSRSVKTRFLPPYHQIALIV